MSSRDDQSNKFLSSDAINDDFFIDVIERKLNTTRDKFKLRLVFIEPATGKNENYVSVLYRAKISVEMIETKEKLFVNVIIKALLTQMKQMKEFAVFEREILMYQDVIESFEKLWSDATGEEAEFGPKCIKVVSDGYEIIVLDDLKPEGYEMVDRKIGVNLNQAKMVLSKLAKFHATSAIRFEKDGAINDLFDRLSFMKNQALTSPDEMQKSITAFMNFYKLLIEATHACGCSDIADKIAKWDQMKIMVTFMSSAEPMKCGLNVLNHGDTWCNNILFKNDADGNSIDMRFIDYQMSFWGSPATDLSYFFISSLADDIKVEHFDDLILFYHEELVKDLKTLNYEKHIPTLSELHIDLLEKGPIVAVFIMLIMFIAKFDSNEELNIEQIMDPEKVNMDVLRHAFMNGTYRNALGIWLPFLNKRGFFDTLLPEAPNTPFMAAILQQMQAMMAPPQDVAEVQNLVELSPENEATEE